MTGKHKSRLADDLARNVDRRLAALRAWLRAAFFENVSLKLVSLVLAVFLFYLTRGVEDEARRTLSVDVITVQPALDSPKVLVSEVPQLVRLGVRGPRSVLESLRRDQIEPVRVDLRDPRQARFDFADDRFELPAGVRILEVDPRSIPLRWETRVTRELRVRAEIVGEPPADHVARLPVDIEPPRVSLTGPRSVIEPMREVRTDPIDIEGLEPGRHRLPTSLRLPRNASRQDDAALSATVEIVADLVERTFQGVAVRVVGPSHGRALPDRVRVTLKGTRAAVGGVDPARTNAIVDTALRPAGARSFRAVVTVPDLPAGVTVLSVDPPQVVVDTGTI